MTISKGSAVVIDAQLLKRLSRMYEVGVSVQDISTESKIDLIIVKRLLKLLGYNHQAEVE